MTFASYFFAILTLVTAIGVISARRPLNSALFLVATLFLIAVHFVLLGADFIGAMQVLVYAGAIMVLVIFVIMLLGADSRDLEPSETRVSSVVAALFSAILVVSVYFIFSNDVLIPGGDLSQMFAATDAQISRAEVVKDSLNDSKEQSLPGGAMGSPENIGQVMFTRFILPFEATGLLLLAAIIGAVLLAKDRKSTLPPGRGLKAKRSVIVD